MLEIEKGYLAEIRYLYLIGAKTCTNQNFKNQLRYHLRSYPCLMFKPKEDRM